MGSTRKAARPTCTDSHNLKANRFDIPVVISAANKLSALCKINRSPAVLKRASEKEHLTKYRGSVTAVTYEISPCQAGGWPDGEMH